MGGSGTLMNQCMTKCVLDYLPCLMPDGTIVLPFSVIILKLKSPAISSQITLLTVKLQVLFESRSILVKSLHVATFDVVSRGEHVPQFVEFTMYRSDEQSSCPFT